MIIENKIKYLGLFLFVLMAIFNIGHIHADEYFQLIEFAQYQLGNTNAVDLSWEFHEKMRPTLQVWIVYIIIKSLHFLQIENPFTITLIMRLLSAVFYWLVITKLNIVLSKKYFPAKPFTALFYATSYLIWFVPFASAHFSSENFSAIFLLLGLYPLIKDPSSTKNLIYTGIFLALSVLFRYQLGISVIGIYLWLLLIAKVPFKKLLSSVIIFTLVILFGTFLDYLFYNEFVIAPYNYLKLNLIDGKASGFGTEPWYYYITQFVLIGFPLISIPLILTFAKGIIPLKKHLFTWTIVPFILVHLMISHKEMRFLFPIIYPFIFISFYGFYTYFKDKKFKKYQIILAKVCLGFNTFFLLFIMAISHEMVNNYKYIYDHIEDGDRRIMSLEKDYYYKMAGLKSTFYSPKNSISEVVNSKEEIADYLNDNQIDKCFFIYKKYNFDIPIDGYTVSRVYSVYPDWLTSINAVDWQKALNTDSVFLIQKNN